MNPNKIFSFLFVVLAVVVLPGCSWFQISATSNSSSNGNNSPGQQSNGTEVSNNPLTSDCGEKALLSYNCWTSEFPAIAVGKSDITCTFLISCCGKDAKNGWDMVYPESAGLRGMVDSGTVESEVRCSNLPALDIDGDGTPDESDSSPIGGDNGWLPWTAKE